MAKKVVVLGGTGDAYLVSALHAEIEGAHGPIEIVTRSRLACVPEMFGVSHSADDELVDRVEHDHAFHKEHDNRVENDVFFAHPCFVRTPFRVDHLTTKPDASQADMYRMILGIDPDAALVLPRLPDIDVVRGQITLIEDSTSWPNTQPGFWPRLSDALFEAGWAVFVNDKKWSLDTLFAQCASSEWVIGPQCGVMSALVTGEFKCRKTLATPTLDDNRRPEYLARQTFPYGYVTKFSNRDYDVEEFKIEDGNHEELVRSVVLGANARRLWSHDPRPVVTVQVTLPPGDFLDRLAVLAAKRVRFSPERAAAQEREYLRYAEMYRQMGFDRGTVEALYHELYALHLRTFDALERLVPETLADRGALHDYTDMVRFNRERIALKAQIDRECHAPYTEIKSYYGDA